MRTIFNICNWQETVPAMSSSLTNDDECPDEEMRKCNVNGTERGICLMTTKWGVNIMVDLVLPLHLGIGVLVEMIGLDVLPCGYERVHLSLYSVADTPCYIHVDDVCPNLWWAFTQWWFTWWIVIGAVELGVDSPLVSADLNLPIRPRLIGPTIKW